MTDKLTEARQGEAERLVFRVLDVDHKDYQAALDGFTAICEAADAARRRWASFPTDDDVETFWRQASGRGVDITRSEVRTALEAVKREDR